MRPVYLDAAATARPDPRVVQHMLHFLEVEFGNQGSRTHGYGDEARRAVERARGQVAAVTGARRGAVIFTSGATEANNLAILGTDCRHAVTTEIEHPAVMEPMMELERRGCVVTRVAPGRSGVVRAEDVAAAVRPETGLVSVMHVNNETGAVQPVREIAGALEAFPQVRFHVDAAQGFGKLLEDLRHPRIDCISASAHKIGGPQGVGALIAQRRQGLRPVSFGGGQEFGLRPGTLPVHLIAGFGLAAELAVAENAERLREARELKAQALAELAGCVANGDPALASPFILSVSFPGLDVEEVIEAWAGIAAVSNGSACASQRARCSYVLEAMGIPEAQAAGAVRLSWYGGGVEPDFRRMAEALHARVA